MKKTPFRKPYSMTNVDGHYITKTQLAFFLNDYAPRERIEALTSDEFTKYYENCVIYNLIYDKMDMDPGCAVLYWDPRKERVAILAPIKGAFPSVETLPSILKKIKNPFK